MKTDCLFCRIIRGDVAATRVYEDDQTLVIQDLHPRASVHWLLLPKVHVASLLEVEDSEFLGNLLLTGRRLAQERGLTGPKGTCAGPRGFRMVINCGPGGGQTIYHLHVHLLGGRILPWSLG